jgi:hypothetical protein
MPERRCVLSFPGGDGKGAVRLLPAAVQRLCRFVLKEVFDFLQQLAQVKRLETNHGMAVGAGFLRILYRGSKTSDE